MYKSGRRASSAAITLFGLPNNAGVSRLGLTVGRKVGCAVVRNHIKRLLREIFRLRLQELEPPMDIVINVHRSARERTARQLEEEFLDSFARLVREEGR